MKITDFSAGFLDKKYACGCVPPIEAEFPKSIEAADGDACKIQRGGAVATDAVRAEREVVVVVNVGAGFAFVHGEAGAEQAGGERGNFGNCDFVSVEGSAFAPRGGEEFLVDGIVDNAG